MKIAIAQMDVLQGQISANLTKILELIREASWQRAELLILPEAALTGVFLGQRIDDDLIFEAQDAAQQIARAAGRLTVIFGNISSSATSACYMTYNGKAVQVSAYCGDRKLPGALPLASKTLSLNDDDLFLLKAKERNYRLACFLGDWPTPPRPLNADLCIHLAAKPLVLEEADAYRRWMDTNGNNWVFANCCGLQNSGKTIYQMAGGSSLRGKLGEIFEFAPLLEEELLVCDSPQDPLAMTKAVLSFRQLPENHLMVADNQSPLDQMAELGYKVASPAGFWQAGEEIGESELIFKSLVLSLQRFLQALGKQKIVIGLSGGIDSALIACVCCKAVGPENLLLINMPTQYNSNTTRNLAEELATALKANYQIIPIEDSVKLTKEQFSTIPIKAADGQEWFLPIEGLTEENIMARDRSARVLAAAAAAWGALFTCNGNKAESTVGYATFYGDLAGAVAPLADLWKHQIYAACEAAAKELPAAAEVLSKIAALRPSAELSREQAVEEGKGDPLLYDYHDYLLAALTEKSMPLSLLADFYKQNRLEEAIGCRIGLVKQLFADDQAWFDDLERWWKQYRGIGIAKRLQAPPLFAFSSAPFGENAAEFQATPYFGKPYLHVKRMIMRKEQ